MGAIEKIGSITTIESMRKENCSPEGIRDCLTEWLSLHPIHLAQNDLRILIQNTAKEARNSNAFARKDKSVRPKTHHFMKGFRKHSSPIRGITSTLGPRETLRKGMCPFPQIEWNNRSYVEQQDLIPIRKKPGPNNHLTSLVLVSA